MAFNGPMYRQERLSKDDIKLLKRALEIASRNEAFADADSLNFLYQKLERMEKGRK